MLSSVLVILGRWNDCRWRCLDQLEDWGQVSLDRFFVSYIFWMILKCFKCFQDSFLGFMVFKIIGFGIGFQERIENRVSKGFDQDGREGLWFKDKGYFQGRVGVVGIEVWDEEVVGRS